MSTERGVQTNRALEEDGWVRRHLADEARALEARQTYTEAGFEVHLERLTPHDFGDKCQGCAATVCSSYVVIYTRKK